MQFINLLVLNFAHKEKVFSNKVFNNSLDNALLKGK